MAKVYAFPEKKKLPKHLEEAFHKNAKEYAELVFASVLLLGKEGIDQMEYEEVLELATIAHIEGLTKAIDELDES
jgi:hypothetical protein